MRLAQDAGPERGNEANALGQCTAEDTTASKGRARRALPILLPVLLAMFPVLALYATNATEVTPSEIVVPLVFAVGAALLLTLVFLLILAPILRQREPAKPGASTRVWDWSKAALITSLFLVLFFSFGHILIWSGGWDAEHRTILPNDRWVLLTGAWLLILLIGFIFITLTRKDLRRLTMILSVVAAAMVAVVTVNIIINEATASEPGSDLAALVETDAAAPSAESALPDIYYIILDRYGSAATLDAMYGYDNSEFEQYLSASGFFVASQSVANYPFTTGSLTSSLNMDYIHEEASAEGMGGNLRDYRVWRFLKSQGYEYVHLGSWWEPTRENPYADININYYAMPEFSWFLFQTTWAYPFCVESDIVDDWQEAQYKRVLYKFDRLAEIPEMEGPTFVLAHMLLPHPPFVFHSDGSFKTSEEQLAQGYIPQYLEQLEATNDMLAELIDRLLEGSAPSPIIVLQADEGPRRADIVAGGSWSIQGASDEELQEKMRILSAYRLPDVEQDALYESISPVNSFRLLFNLYFGTEFDLLPDRSYIHSSAGSHIDVTDRVKYE